MNTEYSLKPTFTHFCKPDSARLARSRQPLHFQKAEKQCGSQRTSNVVVPFGPVQAFASKGTPQSAQRFPIDIERAQEALSRPRKRECVSTNSEDTSLQQFVPHSNRKHAGKVVVARSGKTKFGHRWKTIVLSESPQRLDGRGNICV